MSTRKRHLVSQGYGSYHLISRIAGGQYLLGPEEKAYFIRLMHKLASAFFIDLYAYSVMSNHFHILASCRDEDARSAERGELIRRYRLIYGEKALPLEGSKQKNGDIEPDADGGTERLRYRLGTIAGFMQVLKQRFSRWYNRSKGRKGYLWSDRYNSVVFEKGDPELVCSAYIDLNSVRAGIVRKPEDYRWSSIGLRARNPKKARKILKPVYIQQEESVLEVDSESGLLRQSVTRRQVEISFPVYRGYLYRSGCRDIAGKAKIPAPLMQAVQRLEGRVGIGERLSYRFRNLSEGIVVGSSGFVRLVQQEAGRKHIVARKILKNTKANDLSEMLHCTRCLAPP